MTSTWTSLGSMALSHTAFVTSPVSNLNAAHPDTHTYGDLHDFFRSITDGRLHAVSDTHALVEDPLRASSFGDLQFADDVPDSASSFQLPSDLPWHAQSSTFLADDDILESLEPALSNGGRWLEILKQATVEGILQQHLEGEPPCMSDHPGQSCSSPSPQINQPTPFHDQLRLASNLETTRSPNLRPDEPTGTTALTPQIRTDHDFEQVIAIASAGSQSSPHNRKMSAPSICSPRPDSPFSSSPSSSGGLNTHSSERNRESGSTNGLPLSDPDVSSRALRLQRRRERRREERDRGLRRQRLAQRLRKENEELRRKQNELMEEIRHVRQQIMSRFKV